MTAAVADSIMNGVPYVESLQNWERKYPRTGYGSWFKKWIHLDDTKPYNSFGNGSAMRCSSVYSFLMMKNQFLRKQRRVQRLPVTIKRESKELSLLLMVCLWEEKEAQRKR